MITVCTLGSTALPGLGYGVMSTIRQTITWITGLENGVHDGMVEEEVESRAYRL